jgi:hypothetical protein
VSDPTVQIDIFERALRIAVSVLLLAGSAAIIGSLLDWVTITERPELAEDFDFGDQNAGVQDPEVTEPFNGVEATYGIYSLAGGAVMILGAVLLLARRRGKYAWICFLAAIAIGGIALAAYRGISDPASPLYQRMDIVGGVDPAFGLTLVAAAAIGGLLGSIVGVVATPHQRPV